MSLSGGIGAYYAFSRMPDTKVSYVLAAVAVLALLIALNGHRNAANELRLAFSTTTPGTPDPAIMYASHRTELMGR
jgi:hypothetical protein